MIEGKKGLTMYFCLFVNFSLAIRIWRQHLANRHILQLLEALAIMDTIESK